jgi:hypothetical protein
VIFAKALPSGPYGLNLTGTRCGRAHGTTDAPLLRERSWPDHSECLVGATTADNVEQVRSLRRQGSGSTRAVPNAPECVSRAFGDAAPTVFH